MDLGAICVARGCSGSTCIPRAVKKIFFRRNLQGKCVSAPPGHEVQMWGPFLIYESLD